MVLMFFKFLDLPKSWDWNKFLAGAKDNHWRWQKLLGRKTVKTSKSWCPVRLLRMPMDATICHFPTPSTFQYSLHMFTLYNIIYFTSIDFPKQKSLPGYRPKTFQKAVWILRPQTWIAHDCTTLLSKTWTYLGMETVCATSQHGFNMFNDLTWFI